MRRPFAPLILLLACLLPAAGCGPDTPPAVVEAAERLPDEIDFNLHIKPILSDRCFKCHGPDNNARKADFRLDTEAGAFAVLTKSRRKHALVPGSPGESEIFYRLTSQDDEYRMPPPESNLSISPEEVAYILKWIEQGARYKPHWSLIPPEKPELPAVRDAAWPRNGIDRFILARLEREGLAPAPEAPRETWIRRVTFALTGLPPALDEIDAFLADAAPDAYEKVVDRLLASDAYGEHMAAAWLDLARYADSHGYQDDGMRNMWPWRDWVVRAFNENMPFDRFVTWQLAGDLLPGATHAQRLATGFNRNHMQSQEGGIVLEEYRVEYVADRTNTFARAFLGLTMECARCHDHKFDPISQREYYEIFAFFNSVNEIGNIPYAGEPSPTVILTDAAADRALDSLRAQIRALEARTDPAADAYDAGFQAWLQAAPGQPQNPGTPRGLIGHYPLDAIKDFRLANRVAPDRPATLEGDRDKVPRTVPGRFDAALELIGESFIDVGDKIAHFERNEPFSISLWFNVAEEGTTGPLFSKTGGLFNGLRGYVCMLNADGTFSASLNHVAPDNAIEIQTREPVSAGAWHHLAMTYDGSSRAAGLRLYMDGREAPAKARVDNLKQSILYTVDPETGEQTNWGGAGNLSLGRAGPNMPTLGGVAVDEFRVFDRRLTPLEVTALNEDADPLGELLAVSPAQHTAAQRAALRDHYVTAVDPSCQKDFRRLTALRGEENELLTRQPQVMVMRDLPEPRPSFVLGRGAYDAPTDPVAPGTPAAVLPFPADLPPNRLGLARWLFDARNPLTARVAVNRFWQQAFGRGLVDTPEDFGNQGALPSHPLLLDWLAVTFAASGWDVKALHRLIVLSATYRQSSLAAPALRERDPDNRLLARGPGFRLSAEMIRDNALAVSGLLVRRLGGPPVKPYQPPGLWKELATRNVTEYVQGHGDDLYRRSLYTIWKRTSPPPSMIGFDAADRNYCTMRRQRTSTPLQALVLLNDPQFVEASRLLAERMVREGSAGAEDRITFAFRLLTSRRPHPDELAILKRLYDAEIAEYAADREAARALLRTGDDPGDPRLDPAEAAALTVVASTIMSFDEAVILR